MLLLLLHSLVFPLPILLRRYSLLLLQLYALGELHALQMVYLVFCTSVGNTFLRNDNHNTPLLEYVLDILRIYNVALLIKEEPVSLYLYGKIQMSFYSYYRLMLKRHN